MADDGITLSGGEMQKLMMARALYKNCHLLLLDEPTAALDAISENKMYETYSTLLKNRDCAFHLAPSCIDTLLRYDPVSRKRKDQRMRNPR